MAIQEQSLSPNYYQPIIEAIERKFGKYHYTPRVVLKPALYKSLGALGQTTFVKTADGTPILIEIDAEVWHNRPQMGWETLIHEYPHLMSETYTPQIMAEVMSATAVSALDIFLQRHPLLRRLLLGVT